jgi:hypothetical protein
LVSTARPTSRATVPRHRRVGRGALINLVLLVLAGIWAVVLITPLVRARADGSLGDSIGSFRRHLSVLERAAPTTVPPANRLRIPPAQVAIPPYRPPASPMRRPAASGRRVPSGYGSPYGASPAVMRRRRAQRRRRDVLFALVAGMLGSLMLSRIPGLGAMMWVQVATDLLFVGYVALLIRMRNVSAEREMKLTFLPAHAAVPAPSAYGSYGGPRIAEGYGQAATGYGSLLARQTAN